MKSTVFSRRIIRSGFALIVVLSVVALMTILLIGFLSLVGTERDASTAYRASSSVQPLVDNVISLVETQINIASTQGATVSWASQPGLVRTFDTSGNPVQAFKLYSAPSMILGSDAQPLSLSTLNAGLTSDIPPGNWASASSLWTDLNSPVLNTIGGNNVYTYPIFDFGAGPNETKELAPQGLSVTNPPGASAIQPVPMPVQWLYQLKDGTLVTPDASSTTTATFTSAANKPTSNNPIVGRVAFWTDDDTCKVNINTAGEGTFWDTPRGATQTEQNLANYQPAQNEFQRYPGHPAMTSLSAVFQNLFTPEQIFGLAPRIVGGGSVEGTQIAANPLTPDVDRLYDSVDELIFDSKRSSTVSPNRAQIEQAKFLLTAHSRAPEVNLFSLPRVACWPIYALNGTAYDQTHTTAFDRLIGACSTINNEPYFFQRQNAGSYSADIGITRNTQLYAYLQSLTAKAVPGFGPNTFKSKYGSDRDQILTEIFDYIRSTNLSDDLVSVPYTTPYGSTSNESNPVGHGWVVPTQYTAPGGPLTMGFGRSVTLSEFGIGFICNADGNDTTGSNVASGALANAALGGASLNANQKLVQAIIVMELYSPMYGWTSICPDMQIEIVGLDSYQINGLPLGFKYGITPYKSDPLNLNGSRAWGGNFGWRYFGLNKVAPVCVPLPADPVTTGTSVYPFIGIPVKISSSSGTMSFTGGTVTVNIYAGATSSPSGSKLIQTLSINLPNGTFPIPNLVKTGTITGPFDPSPPAPTSPQNWWAFSTTGGISGFSGRLNYISRPEIIDSSNDIGSGVFFRGDAPYDVVRTVFPLHGDYRLVAGAHSVPVGVFQKHPYYDTPTQFIASNLTESFGGCVGDPGYDTRGKYFSAITYPAGVGLNPDIAAYGDPNGTTQTPEATGDYDSAMPRGMDGPYINKPDEGNIYRGSAGIPYFGSASYALPPGPTFFSPNRMMPSPGMFGSLPTGIIAKKPWQTLLFRPNVNSAVSSVPHPGSAAPEDHLLMDLFWMPVVEPYAISDRFSTAGKINMNYQIIPFNYISRSTGLQALLKGEKVSAIANSSIGTNVNNNYRAYQPAVPPIPDFRNAIDIAQTLTQFDNKFTNFGAANFWDVFKSASEICDQHIVPAGFGASATLASMSSFWQNHVLTGDNMRERIYTTLYPRLTTKSNSYTVHFRVQSLQQLNKSAAAGTWTDGTDVVTAEYRGSATVERYIDPNNSSIPDYAADAASGNLSNDPTLDTFYKWRVVENRQFAP